MKIQKHYKLIIKHVLALVYIWILITGWIRLLSVLVQSSVCKQARHRCEACCRCACYRMWSHTVTNLSSAAQTFQTKRLNAREKSVQKQHTASPTLNWSYSSCQQILWKKRQNQQVFSVQPKPGPSHSSTTDPTHTVTLSGCCTYSLVRLVSGWKQYMYQAVLWHYQPAKP